MMKPPCREAPPFRAEGFIFPSLPTYRQAGIPLASGERGRVREELFISDPWVKIPIGEIDDEIDENDHDGDK